MITVYAMQKIHFEPEYMMEFQEPDGSKSLFKMKDAQTAPLEFIERAIDQMDINGVQLRFIWGLEMFLRENKGRSQTKNKLGGK